MGRPPSLVERRLNLMTAAQLEYVDLTNSTPNLLLTFNQDDGDWDDEDKVAEAMMLSRTYPFIPSIIVLMII